MRHCGRCGAETDDWGLHAGVEARYRAALEQIAGHFLPGDERRTYAGATETLDMIRREAREALDAPVKAAG